MLKRQFAVLKNISTENCNCLSIKSSSEVGDCPSPGCMEFLHFMKLYHKVSWEHVKWGFLDKEDFFIGPNGNGYITVEEER